MDMSVISSAAFWIPVLIGAACSWLFAFLAETLLLKASKNVRGEWISEWQPRNTRQPSHWVREKVRITLGFGYLKMVSRENTGGYQWRAYARIHRGSYLYAKWKSTRPGATSGGVFNLVVNPQGTAMYGTYLGPNDDGVQLVCPVIMARKAADLKSLRKKVAIAYDETPAR